VNKIINFFKNKWVIQFLGITALCLLIWFFAPLISIAGTAILESVMARVITLFVIVLIWFANALRIQIKANKANAQMVDDLVDTEANEQSAEGLEGDNEVGELKNNFDSALQTLKKTSSKTDQGKHYLYDLPWYIIIGPPGSGKTTALINSGLEFPLADRFGKNAVQGVGGTRSCDWWFTDQAVILDTAGRYTTQDSHQLVDKAAWQGFLDLLKKHRPRRPLNGVLITMSLSDLLRLTEEERSLHAKAIRQRIEELTERMGIRIPIYMIFTKTDLIAGFTDFFADLGKDERRQVWGVTFPEQEDERGDDHIATIGKEYDQLLARLNQRVNNCMQNERDLNRRNLIFGFPQRISMLKQPVIQFLEECFAVNRYQSAPLLRGVYLTSGTQEGTPIDRLMGVLANTFKLDRLVSPIFSGQGKSYFITRLLKDVIFSESELVGLNKQVEKRRTLMQQFFYGTALFLVVSCTGLWVNSYFQNQSLINQFNEQTSRYNILAEQELNSPTDFIDQLAKMDALFAIANVYPEDVSWFKRMGLYQGDNLSPLVLANYHKQLKNHFLPMIKHRLEQRMVSEESNNVEILYQILRVYLMLGDSSKADKNLIRSWVKVDWGSVYTDNDQKRLTQHLDALLELELPSQAMDESLIKEVRNILTQIPVAQQVYMRIKAQGLQNHDNDFILMNELGASGARVFSVASSSFVIPGLYTYNGFHEIFLNESKDLAKQTVEQRWVLGKDSFSGGKNLDQLEGKLFKYYYAEYINRWDNMLANLKIRRPDNIPQSTEILEIVSGYDSPLKRLFEAVERETTLTRIASGNKANALDKLKEGSKSVNVGSRMQKLLNAAKSVAGDSATVDKTGKEVEKHFARLNKQVQKGSTGSSPMDQIIADLSVLYGTMKDLDSTSDSGAVAVDMVKQGSGGGDVIAKMQRQSARLPAPMDSLVKELASGSQGLIMGGVSSQLSRMLKTDVGQLCKTSIERRYPVSKKSRNSITLQDFGHFFSPSGVMDQFFQENLQAFVDTSRQRWRVISQNDQTVGISASTLKQFQNAAKIRDVFFQGGGSLPKIQFDLKPIFLDTNASRFWMNIEGQQTNYRHGPTRSNNFSWPGVRPGSVRFGFETLAGKQLSHSEEGAWALFRLLDKVKSERSGSNTHIITFEIEGFTAKYELRASSVLNPFFFTELSNFKCPNRI